MSGLVTAYEIPAAGPAEMAVLHHGHAGLGGDHARVSDTVISGQGAPFRPRESA
jgi:hypothetical protein